MAENQTQPRDQDVVTYETFAGLRNDVTPERFRPNDLATAVNVDIDKSGRVSRRAGFSSVMSGAVHSLWADKDLALYVSGNLLNKLNTDYSSTALGTLSGVGCRMSYQRVNNRAYFSNTVDTGIYENGSMRSWGIVPPPSLSASVTVGNMPAGTYQYTQTYFRNDGQESGATRARTIQVPSGGGLAFSLFLSNDPTVVSSGVYITPPNGDTLYLAGIVPGSAFTYTNDTSELSTPLETQFITPPPAGQLVSYYRGYMCIAKGDTLYMSQPYAYEQFDLRDYLQLDGEITLLATMTDKERDGDGQHSGFFVGTDKTCGVIIGTDPNSFQYVPKTDYGAILGAVDYVDGSLYGDNSIGARLLPMWLTTEGICIGVPDMNINNLTRTKYSFAAGGQGAALFQPGPNRFIATSLY